MSERFRSIAVLLDDQPHSDARLELAISAASVFGAHLDGVFVTLPMHDAQAASDSFARGRGMDDAIGNLMQVEHDAAVRQRTCLHAAAEQLRVTARWRELSSQMALADVAARMASYDLLILPPPDGSFDRSPWSPADLVFVAGVAGVVVPRHPLAASFATHVAIAWNGSHVARRAVADALPLLMRAAEVEIIVIEEGRGSAESDELTTLLARHNITPGVRRVAGTGRDVGDAILAEASALGADLLVAGAYGHARWAEVIFGSTTRRLLDRAPLPILIAH